MLRPKNKIFLFILLATLPLAVWASESSQPVRGFLDNLACIQGGNCGLDDIAVGFVALINLLLGMMGAVALVYFIWGGVIWITSGGNMEKVGRGRNIMINTVLAIVVAFSSYIILDFFVNDLLGANKNFAVSAECAEATDGTRCKSGPHQCYKGACLTKCEIVTRKIADAPDQPNIPPSEEIVRVDNHDFRRADTFACERVENLSSVGHFTDYCPGNDTNFVCVFRRNGRIQSALP